MAERNEQQQQQQSNWWGSWIDTAKSKSASMYEAVKKDLDELSTAVRTEASNAGTALAESLKIDEPDSTANVVKKSISSFFGQVTEALIPTIEDDDSEAILITNDGSITLTGFQKHLAELQKNDDTYSVEPQNELIGKYKRWMEVVEQDQFTESRLSKYLASSQILNDKYIKLVPEKIPHMEFWKRYLFKKALLEDAMANAEMAERKAKVEMNSNTTISLNKTIIQTTQPKKIIKDETDDDNDDTIPDDNDEDILKDDLKWIGDEFNCNDVELSEEEQARLLAEYEQEIQGRDKRKPDTFLDDQIKIPTNDKKTIKTDNKNEPSAVNKKQSKNNLPLASAKINNNGKQQSQQPQVNKNSNKNKVINQNDTKKISTKVLKQQQQLSNDKEKEKQQLDDNSSEKLKLKTEEKMENLKIEKNHFTKDDISSNSDESWEKEFDLDE